MASSPNRFAALFLFSLLLTCFLRVEGNSSYQKIGQGYRLISIKDAPQSDGALQGLLQVNQNNNIYGPDIPLLRLYVKHETENRLRVHITDAKNQRWEVPYNLLPREQPANVKQNIAWSRKRNLIAVSEYSYDGSDLVFSYTSDPFSFAVKRKSNGDTLFDSNTDEFNTLVFKDQYLEISTKLPQDASLYGLGESTRPHGIKLYPNDPYTLYATDVTALALNTDLYGEHPVYMDLRNKGGKPYAHGVLLLNSNGMDVFYVRKKNYADLSRNFRFENGAKIIVD